MKRADIERLLPGVFRRGATPGSPLDALLGAMEAMQTPAEQAMATFSEKLDPRRTPDAFLPLLAHWVGVDFAASANPGRVRELIASAARLASLRGTRRGLIELLEVATGETGFDVDEHVRDATGKLRPFHLRVLVPKAALAQRDMIETIVEREKPAHLTWELSEATSGAKRAASL